MHAIPPRVTGVRVLRERIVEVVFADETSRVVDLEPYLWGPVFEHIAVDDAAFTQVFVDQRLGTIAWPNGADVDPDVLYGVESPVHARTSPPTAE